MTIDEEKRSLISSFISVHNPTMQCIEIAARMRRVRRNDKPIHIIPMCPHGGQVCVALHISTREQSKMSAKRSQMDTKKRKSL